MLRRYVQMNYGSRGAFGGNRDTLPYYGAAARVKGKEILQNPTTAYIIAAICAFILYQMDKNHDIICDWVFNYRHPQCKRADPLKYERAYRSKLHSDFGVYEAPLQDSENPFGISKGLYFLLLSIAITCLLLSIKRVMTTRFILNDQNL